MAYQNIEDYGIVGDMETVALVGINGSIDWFCYPRFDSPSVFGAILDDKKGGRYSISPDGKSLKQKQFYWPETNVLITRFLCREGVGEVIDFMTIPDKYDEHNPHAHRRLYRRVRQVRGSLTFRMHCNPAFNYGRDSLDVSPTASGVAFSSSALNMQLSADVPIEITNEGCRAELNLHEGDSVLFILQEMCPACAAAGISKGEAQEEFRRTVEYWRAWISTCSYTGRWREMVHRSALALKLLTFKPTGAIVAAPTCSLPEAIGGERNWDYRYTWIRDAAFTLYGLLRIGFTQEAEQFMNWLEARCRELSTDGSLQVMYGLGGEHKLDEQVLSHWEGYRGSGPVRIGNGAYGQLQLDIYGELMDSVYLYNKYGSPISYDLWNQLRRLMNWVAKNWNTPDEGVWETRGGRQHFVYSKVMCWVALDRALRLADKRSFPADRNAWLSARDMIYETVMKQGWNEKRKAFVQHFGSRDLDASTLIMPLVFFMSPDDRRMLSTLDAVLESPQNGGLVSDSLVYRYNTQTFSDGLQGSEGTFNICSFWLVEALTRAGRVHPKRLEQARLIFEQMLGYANHLGLYAEETGPTGEALGNFPQAFTHLALISAAYNLNRALDR
ncbi:MAG: glycoside hydrolase family 15 protein [candidate division KSB1 bacterium]|nr:glycoside hydrolase family 15 protein [candidate division KSB1 bacterium]